MHELSHTLGHNDFSPASHTDDLMSATLAPESDEQPSPPPWTLSLGKWV